MRAPYRVIYILEMTQHQAKYDVVHRRHVLDIRQKVRFLNSLIQWFSNCRTCTTGGTQGDLILRWVLEYSRSLCFQNWTKSTSTCSATSLCSTSLANDLMRWWCDVGLCFMQVIPEETIFFEVLRVVWRLRNHGFSECEWEVECIASVFQ